MYEVFSEILTDIDNNEYIAYGIRCMLNNYAISDISTNKNKIDKFVKTLNTEQLECIHLRDVIEDFLDELQ